jgi:hypothetical protein
MSPAFDRSLCGSPTSTDHFPNIWQAIRHYRERDATSRLCTSSREWPVNAPVRFRCALSNIFRAKRNCARAPRGGQSHGMGPLIQTLALDLARNLECTPLPTCKQAVYEEDDDCANYGTDQSRALARAVPS